MTDESADLLTPADVRRLADRAGLRPSRSLGQNFVIDQGTVRRITRRADLDPNDVVIEVGPGLGSLTLALLPHVRHITALEVDPALAAQLPGTVNENAPGLRDRLTVVTADALQVTELPPPAPTALVANLPYNVAVPVVLRLLEYLPTLRRGLVMVQAEVAERIVAPPGSRTYGVPSAKIAWYATARRAGSVGRSVFWPAPNVDSGLVALERREPPQTTAERTAVFAVVDAAFAQRRKTLRTALASWAGSASAAEAILRRAGVDPGLRGERLDISHFARIAAAGTRSGPGRPGGCARP